MMWVWLKYMLIKEQPKSAGVAVMSFPADAPSPSGTPYIEPRLFYRSSDPSRWEFLTSLKSEDATHEVGCYQACMGFLYNE
ncbi:MAG: hypothetical protein VZQ84_01525 [Anaerovoracaceae bacterium]|nr:hypothetical protein [Anaerovoracaceae bacterium]